MSIITELIDIVIEICGDIAVNFIKKYRRK